MQRIRKSSLCPNRPSFSFLQFVYSLLSPGYERTDDREISWPSPQLSVTEEAMLHSVKHFLERVWWAALAYGIALKYVFYEFLGKKFGKNKNCYGNAYPRQDGKEAVVTGGSRGIGLEIVNNLLQCGYNVVIGSSSSEASRTALRDSLLKKHPGCSVEVWHLDLASMKSVKDFADHYMSTKSACHLLINNAGIMFVKEERTVDGYEKHFSVNYLGHCLLTQLLLPLLAKSSCKENHSRIVNCTSCIHFVGSKDVTDFKTQKYYSKYKAYIDSKLAQVMFTSSLQTYLDRNNLNVKVNCVHPGVVDTDLMNSVLLIPRLGSIFFKSAEEGAQTATHVSLSPQMEHVGGKYLEECRVVASSKISEDKCLQMELWEKTWKALHPWLSENGYNFINVSDKPAR